VLALARAPRRRTPETANDGRFGRGRVYNSEDPTSAVSCT
jgi:hypothetical protein